jgi:hypothetical protein
MKHWVPFDLVMRTRKQESGEVSGERIDVAWSSIQNSSYDLLTCSYLR